MTLLARGVFAALLIVTAIALWLRFAAPVPDDLDLDIAAAGLEARPGWVTFCPVAGWREGAPDGDSLDPVRDALLALPRTEQVAGSTEAGPMTFVTRSRIFGVAVYTTVALRQTGADGTPPFRHFCIVSRSAVPFLGPVHARRTVARVIAGLYGPALAELPGPVWQVNTYAP